MSLLDEYSRRHINKPSDPAKRILFAILNDLSGRSGIDNAFDNIDEETMEELLKTNLEIVRQNLA